MCATFIHSILLCDAQYPEYADVWSLTLNYKFSAQFYGRCSPGGWGDHRNLQIVKSFGKSDGKSCLKDSTNHYYRDGIGNL